MQIKRTALTAIVIAAAAAPNAPAMPARDPGTVPAKQHTIKPAHDSSRFEEMAALRRYLRDREVTQAQSAPVAPLVRDAGDGFHWRSALIGAAVPLTLLLAAVAARPAVTRRRSRVRALA
jgi:predicted component of type VI protein secretion system